jgi:hypothetical protein
LVFTFENPRKTRMFPEVRAILEQCRPTRASSGVPKETPPTKAGALSRQLAYDKLHAVSEGGVLP